jgi:hypothetical protein
MGGLLTSEYIIITYLFLDVKGKVSLTIKGLPLAKEPPTAIEFSVANTLRDIFNKFGFVPSQWL